MDNNIDNNLTEEKMSEGNAKSQNKTHFALYFAIICLLLVGLTVFTVLSTLKAGGENRSLTDKVTELSDSVDKLNNRVSQSLGVFSPEDESEDDIYIAGQFRIESTLPVSDAYKSGDDSDLDDRQKETLDMAKEVLDSIVTENMSDYDKELAVYKWLTTQMENETGHLTVISTASDDAGNPYGVLKYHKAVCAGYATTFRLFMQMLDIDCKVVHNTSRNHSWDLVNLDGDWYHVDCYMDSGSGNCRNFNMNDSACSLSHDWCQEFYPKANGEKYSYSLMNMTELDNIYDIPAWTKELIDSEAQVGSCCFKERIEPEDEPAASLLAQTLVDALNFSDSYSDEMYFVYLWSESEERGYVFTLYLERYEKEDPDNNDVDPEIGDRINEAIADVFGEEVLNYYYDEKDYYDETTVYYSDDDLD